MISWCLGVLLAILPPISFDPVSTGRWDYCEWDAQACGDVYYDEITVSENKKGYVAMDSAEQQCFEFLFINNKCVSANDDYYGTIYLFRRDSRHIYGMCIYRDFDTPAIITYIEMNKM